jgi:geranylgeranyl diphosphate synthase type I
MPARSTLPAGLAEIGSRTERRIVTLLDAERARWCTVDPALAQPFDALRDLVTAGGKAVRPGFCHWAFVGAGGDPDDERLVDLCAAVELLHACALVHDDVIDGSSTRRGRPSVHQRFVDEHAVAGARGEDRRYGEGAAILVGDFAFVYADVLFASAPSAVRPVYDAMRIELCAGQFLDVVGSAAARRDAARADRIQELKTGKYTVERPLHLGAALADRLAVLEVPLSAFGVPLGRAFQLRDDLLGVFGDAITTGKPVGDDVREGKLTPLLAAAVAAADEEQAAILARVGEPDLDDGDVRVVRDVLLATGAVDAVERTITELVERALVALDGAPLVPDARDALAELARFVAWRNR